jgi:hypothetical protein
MVTQTPELRWLHKPYEMIDWQKHKLTRWQSRGGMKPDIITNYFFFEIKDINNQLSRKHLYEQLSKYYATTGKTLAHTELLLRQLIEGRHTEETFIQEVIKGAHEVRTDGPHTKIEYKNRELVERILRNQGKLVLGRVIDLIINSIREGNWPLVKIQMRYVRDHEIADWQYVLIMLVFDSDFDSADRYLHDLYDKLDSLTEELSEEQQSILRRTLFFDAETTVS